MTTESTETGVDFHRTNVWREVDWPQQWLGTCSCGVGIRCNSQAEAEDFLVANDCMDPEMRASSAMDRAHANYEDHARPQGPTDRSASPDD